MAMNSLSHNQTDVGRDLLLKSGSTWIDAISDVLDSLHLDASVWFALDPGEEITLRDGPDGHYIRLAARPWGLFVTVGSGFYITHLGGGVIHALTIISEATPGNWELLPNLLKLEEFNHWEFQRLGYCHMRQALFEDGWVEMSDDQYLELTNRHGLKFHSFESVPINLDAVLPNCETARGSIRSTQGLFTSNRPLFWRYENLMRQRVVDALMHLGGKCSTILCFCVNHSSYVLRRPARGWEFLADATWPIHLTDPGGRVLLFIPDLQEALVADETQGTIVGYGRELSMQLASVFQECPSVWCDENG